MGGSMRDRFAGNQGQDFGESCPRPGVELVGAIAAFGRPGRPIYFAPVGLPVPLMDFVAGPEPGLVGPIWLSFALPRLMPLADFIAAEPPRHETWRLARGRQMLTRVPGRKQRAAYNADILGRRDHHGPEGDALRRDVRDGRAALARLGAWPWAVYGPTGRPPRLWWRGEPAAISWAHWASGAPRGRAGRRALTPRAVSLLDR
jgi:hypothetical protein